MKFLIFLMLASSVVPLFSQNGHWTKDTPESVKGNKGPFKYYIGEGDSYADAIVEAIKIIGTKGGVSVEVIRQKTNSMSGLLRSSEKNETVTLDFGVKKFDVELVQQHNSGDDYYVLYSVRTEFYRDGDSPGILGPGHFVKRSIVAPGWGQFYNRESSKGLLFSLGEVGLIAGAIFSFGQASNHKQNADNALLQGNIAQFTKYDQKENNLRTTGTILGISAAALWVLNIIDATASRKRIYAKNREEQRFQILAQTNQLGLKYSF